MGRDGWIRIKRSMVDDGSQNTNSPSQKEKLQKNVSLKKRVVFRSIVWVYSDSRCIRLYSRWPQMCVFFVRDREILKNLIQWRKANYLGAKIEDIIIIIRHISGSCTSTFYLEEFDFSSHFSSSEYGDLIYFNSVSSSNCSTENSLHLLLHIFCM